MKKHLFLFVFSVFFALFGGVGGAYADNFPECDYRVPIGDFDSGFDGASFAGYNVSGFDIEVYLSDGRTMFATAYCSVSDNGSGDAPDEDTGQYCWCGLNRYSDGNQTFSSNITTWRFSGYDMGSYEDCEAECAVKCYEEIISPDPAEYGNNLGLCLEFEEACADPTNIADYDGDFCSARVSDPDYSYPDWSLELDGGQRITGTAFCSYADDNYNNTTPGTLPGQHCWCGISEYTDGASSTYTSNPATWWYSGGASDINTCENDCAIMCARDFDDPDNRCDIDRDIGICYSASPATYNVTYSCGIGSGNANDPTSYSAGQTVTALAGGRCNAPSEHYTFANWSCTGGVGNVTGGGTFTMPATNITCTAQWNPNIYTITLRNYNNTSTHSTIYEKYATGWYSNAAATQVLSQASKPTRSGYTFRGFYTATQTDLTATGGAGTRRITNTGGLPTNTTFTANTNLYAAWARNCSPGTGCTCSLAVNSDGTVTYTSGAQTGYTLTSGNGTYAPVCALVNYTVSFAAGSGSGTMSEQTGKHYGDTITLPANGFTAPSGYMFNGWSCDNSIGNKSAGETFSMPAASVTCTAQWAQVSYPFTLSGTTTSSSAVTFTFNISAAGTFYVDCGNYGTLSGDSGVSGNVITKNDTTSETFACRYPSGVRSFTIRFGGLATAYTTSSNSYPAISFQSSASLISSVSGDLSAVFPYLGSTDGQYPRFIGTFNGASGLTSIPNTLFSSLTGSGSYMFSDTFNGCTGLTSIPSGLFNFSSNNVSGAEGMFSSTFYGCTGLTGANAIPSNLFSRITSGAEGLFGATFSGCTGLTSIPTGLFNFGGNSVAGANTMFDHTFEGCTGLTSVPSGLLGSFTSGGTSMFIGMFNGCSNLASLPDNLFSFTTNVTGMPYMFAQTFNGCTSLTSLPSGLFNFNNHTMTGSEGMFEHTFDGCTGLTSIPGALFTRITTGADSLFAGTFYGCSGLTSIPSTLFNFNSSNSVSGQPYMFSSTFNGCNSVTTLPDGLFARITTPATYMFDSTFANCTGLTGYIPTDFFGGLIANGSNYTTNMMSNVFNNTGSLRTTTTGCPTNMQQYITGYESYWDTHISCENASSFSITYYNSDCSTVLTGLTPTTYTVNDNVTLPTPTKTGYTFNSSSGWCGSCGSNCGLQGWSAGGRTGNQSIYMSSNAWNPSVYTIRLRNYNNTSTHSTIYEKYATGWYSNAAATQVLSQASKPTRSGYTFRGFYTTTQTDLTASGGNSIPVIDASGTLPLPTSFIANTDLYAAWATNCNPGTGCNCTLTVNDDGTVTYTTSAQTGYTLTSGSGTYAPVCTGNSVSLTWDGGGTPTTCTYGDTFVPPTPATRTGYVFTGWKMCSLSGFNASINGTENGYISGNGTNSLNAEIYGLTDNGTFATKFSYATLYGESRCSATIGNTQGEPGIPSESSGQYCWCGVNKFQTPGMQSQCELSSINWVYDDYHGSQAECLENCADGCGYLLQVSSTVRAVAFGQ